ncbi:bifunctional UDP-N-acetylglucosamine diphosphorylase/glucosamine-1-phosphate N-acetyltransferase GlmU [Azovibrio restrictus]|uniref:bifunctional UDP-N-acetylglucosamine diphosphorylase/glucosamine-1-phosphate N-acetyltransferase GlmU n=1 Tax=Azovibrio restrictus TaxID=146938 RepID=UPI0026ED6D02|nr:bifunctional UDP-N-acetylglucosamine diphosphorylase/glucosamine-1-phosphate N-acetyltransferase GlmU [Azovibrio restrictus]MDD3482763.1 bifunctional UDP-N-acetylglucosamine diphosphorylase/glucosamine-1-phosphate N-acetyltransferase GlmU [Azovibrio restrictus]
MNIVILAAGQGKRMYSNLPKVLHPLAGKALLRHVVDTARTLQPARLVVVYGHGGEAVRQNFAGEPLAWALQEPQLGTGHALAQALPQLDESLPTLVLYGDVPLVQQQTLEHLVQQGARGLGLLTVRLAQPQGYGRIVRDAAGAVTAIVEEKDATPEERHIDEVNTGIMVLPGGVLAGWLASLSNHNAQGEYYLTDVVAKAVAEGVAVRTVHPLGPWEVQGVNNKQQLAELERAYQLRQAEAQLEQGVRLADPARLDIRGTLACGRDVSIDVGCIFEGRVVLEEAVEIGPYCVIRNATVQAGARIAAFTHIDGAQVGPDAVVGPYARLRPGTMLAEGAHVGNFVEIKNSQIGSQSKANHLAYVGDADVGARVNIGAGTITCNYDGANKFRTVIEDDAFIGSDTQLVAPVRVGRGATLGAGTTLTKDAPPGGLTVSRARQATISNWKRPEKNKA